ncbi:unnamed protein product [Moneuplotes crassus]|uniref:Uncharacterized protein n=1 Tax=Euplotes crassus TaxID=5936 RepID=A0AAD1UMD9_EUPCR|nr:unnamed protein product [Moneuplotes crassus]
MPFQREQERIKNFLSTNGNITERKSMVFSQFFGSWVRNYTRNLCNLHNINSQEDKERLFFYHIVLSYPEEKVEVVLNFFFDSQPEELEMYQSLLRERSVQSKVGIQKYYAKNPYFKIVLDDFTKNLDNRGKELVPNEDVRAKMIEVCHKITEGI